MKKIVYLTIFPNPFQFEFTNAVKKGLGENAQFMVVYEKELPEFRKHWGNFKSGTTLGKEISFTKYLNEENPDVLVFTMYNSKVTAEGIKWARKHGRDFYFGPHEVLRGDGVHPIVKYLKLLRYKYIARHAKGIMTMGNQSVRELSTMLPNKRIISIPYSFDLSRLLSFKKETQPDELVFLMSGGLYDFRNPFLGIKIFHRLVNQNPDKRLKLLISGQGPLYDDCLSLIQKLQLTDHVDWKNDFEDWYDIHNIYKMADVLLALQKWGTWGIIIQEAMAAGLGIISTNTIQAADNLIINEHNGFLTTLHESDILQSMQKYVDNFSLADEHGKRNQVIAETVDVSRASSKFIDFVEEAKN